MADPAAVYPSHEGSHEGISARLVLTSVIIFIALTAAATLLREQQWAAHPLWAAPVVVAQSLWLYRLYVVGHEGVHKKLFPRNRWVNDLVASLLLLPIGAPLSVYRKVHYFHHGSNRKDSRHAALDHFHVRAPITPAARLYYRAVWTFYVFGAGFFLHSLITIVIFLIVPGRWATRIDPVFARWSPAARARAWVELLASVALHLAVAQAFGGAAWFAAMGLPLLLFAWIWSLLLYVYHYDTTVGPNVRFNVRSLPRQRFFSWLLLNFNEHVTHHADPAIPWYELPRRSTELPAGFEHNQGVPHLWAAIWRQRRGPVLCDRTATSESRS